MKTPAQIRALLHEAPAAPRSVRRNPTSRNYSATESPPDVLYPMTMTQRRWAVDSKASGIIDMRPLDFIRIANTCSDSAEATIREKAAPLEKYLSPEWESIIHPLLKVDVDTGEVRSHEGRHRAAAVHKAGGRWYRVAIVLTRNGYADRSLSMRDAPSVWRYKTCTWNWRHALDVGGARIVNDNVQGAKQ